MSEKRYPSQSAERIIVRLPDGMRDRLAEAARGNKRSTNAEVVARLEASFAQEEVLGIALSPKEREEARRIYLNGFHRAVAEMGGAVAERLGSDPQTGELLGDLFLGGKARSDKALRTIKKGLRS